MDCFVQVRAHTEAHPLFTKANSILKALDNALANSSILGYYASIFEFLNKHDDHTREASLVLLACVLAEVPVGIVQQEAAAIWAAVKPLTETDKPYMGSTQSKSLSVCSQSSLRLTGGTLQPLPTSFTQTSSSSSPALTVQSTSKLGALCCASCSVV
jgi:hypothetical protein